MDVLKQLEARIQGLIGQRNQLREMVTHLQEVRAAQDETVTALRRDLEELTQERDLLAREREEVSAEVASLLRLAEDVD